MGASAASIGVAVRTLFIVLFCVMVAAFVYLFIFGDFFSCYDVNSRWWLQLTSDFAAFAIVIGTWIAYKESSWTIAIVLFASETVLGSLIIIGYILLQFHKFSREERSKDPLYFVLARHEERDVMEHTSKEVYVAREIFSISGVLFLGVLIYTFVVDISPFYTNKYFSKCTLTTIIDVYTFAVILSVWIAYKESSWTSAFIWIVLLLCFRSITICVYIAWQLFHRSPQQPVSFIIFSSKNRDLHSSDPLMTHPIE